MATAGSVAQVSTPQNNRSNTATDISKHLGENFTQLGTLESVACTSCSWKSQTAKPVSDNRGIDLCDHS
jgi:hypothetical protein